MCQAEEGESVRCVDGVECIGVVNKDCRGGVGGDCFEVEAGY